MTRILLLAGTGEARLLAAELSRDPKLTSFASLAGATARPESLDLPTRIGGFGGVEALIFWLKDRRIDLIIDATHPFATQISKNARIAAMALLKPRVQLSRPPWEPECGDNWRFFPSLQAAAGAIKPRARVFLATGRTSLPAFAHRDDCWFLARVIDPASGEFPLAQGRYTSGRPPFSVEDEITALENDDIDLVVTKNAGGQNSFSKLEAARHLGLDVYLIDRPPSEEGDVVETVEAALRWVEDHRHG